MAFAVQPASFCQPPTLSRLLPWGAPTGLARERYRGESAITSDKSGPVGRDVIADARGDIVRLNLGCGSKKLDGWVNVDKIAAATPDQVVDLEALPWPWPDDSVDEVLLSHVLEHLGAETDVYLGIIKELYRICRDGARITIVVPHPRHDHYLNDPTHVRPITADSIVMFSQAANRNWIAAGIANTPLGIYIGVDFVIETHNSLLGEPWRTRLERKEVSETDVRQAAQSFNNVIQQIELIVRAVKPAGRTSAAGGQAA
jgi:hypothetical protein